VRLLIVEDEARIAEILTAALQRVGFAIDAVSRCADACEALSLTPYDAVVLDLGLPDGDGLGVLAHVRSARNQTPILVLTARDTIDDRVCGLNAGADDYLVKPFAMAELVARINALLRRPGGALGATLHAGNIAFDTIERNVGIGGSPLLLSRRECTVLEHLMRVEKLSAVEQTYTAVELCVIERHGYNGFSNDRLYDLFDNLHVSID